MYELRKVHMRYTRVRIFPNVAFDLFNPGVGVFDNGSLKKKNRSFQTEYFVIYLIYLLILHLHF